MIFRNLNFNNNEEIFFLVCVKFIIFATLKNKLNKQILIIKKQFYVYTGCCRRS